MVRGCPEPKHPHPFVLVISFTDGSMMKLTDDMDADTRESIKKVLADMRGEIFTFTCGTSA